MGRPDPSNRPGPTPTDALGPALVLVGLLWASWPSLGEMVARWSTDPRYSHGFLVPAFSAYLLWTRRGLLEGARRATDPRGLAADRGRERPGPGRAPGTIVPWFQALALLPSLAGLALLAGGRTALRWAGPLDRLPGLHGRRSLTGSRPPWDTPSSGWRRSASTYALQTIGLPAVSEGNIILLDDARIGVVEACNGLGMLLMFFAFATAVALVVRRRPGRSGCDHPAAPCPIALFANVARITATGVLHRLAGGKAADVLYHDLAGWLMMPLALVAFGLELKLLSLLFVELPDAGTGAAFGPTPRPLNTARPLTRDGARSMRHREPPDADPRAPPCGPGPSSPDRSEGRAVARRPCREPRTPWPCSRPSGAGWSWPWAWAVLAAALAGGGAYLLVPRAKYTATATLHVSTNPKRIIFDPQERETDYRTYQKTQVALLKNRKVLPHALAEPGGRRLQTVREQVDADEWLEQNLKADFPGGSEVLQVSLSGDRPGTSPGSSTRS